MLVSFTSFRLDFLLSNLDALLDNFLVMVFLFILGYFSIFLTEARVAEDFKGACSISDVDDDERDLDESEEDLREDATFF